MTSNLDGGYEVTVWCSHPDLDNDDCDTGEDFDNFRDAMKAYANPRAAFPRSFDDGCERFVMLEGPCNLRQIVILNKGICSHDDYSAERSERAMQAGMTFGCNGYNDAMGY